VDEVRVLDGVDEAAGVREIVSYEGRFRDVGGVGTQIEARGKVESVDGEPRRLVVGTTELGGQDYVKPFRS
jgi:predicted nucleotidyltransferase